MQIAFTATLSDRPVDSNAPVAPAAAPQLGVEGFTYAQLRDPQHLARLTSAFEAFAQKHLAPEAWSLFTQYRDGKGEGMAPEEVSSAILAAAPALGAFVATLFGVTDARAALAAAIGRESVVFAFKREFVKKRTARRKRAEMEGLDATARTALDRAARAVLSAATALPDHWNDEAEVAAAVMPLVRAEDLFRKALARGGVSSTPDDLARAAALRDALAASPEASARTR